MSLPIIHIPEATQKAIATARAKVKEYDGEIKKLEGLRSDQQKVIDAAVEELAMTNKSYNDDCPRHDKREHRNFKAHLSDDGTIVIITQGQY